MIKEDLIVEIARKTGYTRTVVSSVLENALVAITEAVSKGRKVHLSGFGVFEKKHRAPRVGRDLNNNTAFPIPARDMPVFTPLSDFKALVNSAGNCEVNKQGKKG